jgi:hypothetical protein
MTDLRVTGGVLINPILFFTDKPSARAMEGRFK